MNDEGGPYRFDDMIGGRGEIGCELWDRKIPAIRMYSLLIYEDGRTDLARNDTSARVC